MMSARISRASLPTVVARIDRLTPETQRRWGTMSVVSMMQHIADALRRTSRPDTGLPDMRTWYLHGPGKLLMLYLVPWPKGIRAPKGILIESQESFDASRETLLTALHGFLDYIEANPKAGTRHPYFGRLSARQLRRFQWKHIDHHLRQFGV